MRRTMLHVLVAGVCAFVALTGACSAAADMTGRWLISVAPVSERVDVVESGGTVSFTLGGTPITATRTGNTLFYHPSTFVGF